VNLGKRLGREKYKNRAAKNAKNSVILSVLGVLVVKRFFDFVLTLALTTKALRSHSYTKSFVISCLYQLVS